MPLRPKAGRGGAVYVQGTARQLVQPVAYATVEMMMVAPVGGFVEGPQIRMRHGANLASLEEHAQVPVHRGPAQAGGLHPASFHDVVD